MAKREGIWFLIEFDGSRGALCKYKGAKLTHILKNEILSAKHKLEVEIALDFFSPLRQVPMRSPTGQVARSPDGQPLMGVGRESIVTGNHFMMDKAPSYVNMSLVSKVTFVDDMTAFDQKTYDRFIVEAQGNLEEQRKAASPLALPPPRDSRLPISPDGVIDLSQLRPEQ